MGKPEEEQKSIVEIAKELAFKWHAGQFRWDGTTPFVTHPVAVAANFTDEQTRAVALLHDILEDTACTKEDLKNAGIPTDVIVSVVWLTRLQGQDYLGYILGVKRDKMACQVKIADINHNLLTVLPKNQSKYKLALWILQEPEFPSKTEIVEFCMQTPHNYGRPYAELFANTFYEKFDPKSVCTSNK